MARTERIFRLHNILSAGKPISRKRLEAVLEMSRATVTRDIEYMRDFMGAPIAQVGHR